MLVEEALQQIKQLIGKDSASQKEIINIFTQVDNQFQLLKNLLNDSEIIKDTALTLLLHVRNDKGLTVLDYFLHNYAHKTNEINTILNLLIPGWFRNPESFKAIYSAIGIQRGLIILNMLVSETMVIKNNNTGNLKSHYTYDRLLVEELIRDLPERMSQFPKEHQSVLLRSTLNSIPLLFWLLREGFDRIAGDVFKSLHEENRSELIKTSEFSFDEGVPLVQGLISTAIHLKKSEFLKTILECLSEEERFHWLEKCRTALFVQRGRKSQVTWNLEVLKAAFDSLSPEHKVIFAKKDINVRVIGETRNFLGLPEQYDLSIGNLIDLARASSNNGIFELEDMLLAPSTPPNDLPVYWLKEQQYYKHAISPAQKSRFHFFTAKSDQHSSVGDALKTEILTDLDVQLRNCQSSKDFTKKVEEIKRGKDYKVLTTSQGLSRFFPIKTSSEEAFEKLRAHHENRFTV